MVYRSSGGGSHLVELTGDIVASFVSHNAIGASEIGRLIAEVHAALIVASTPEAEMKQAEHQRPAVPVKKSVTADFLVCLEDGMKLKSLKRHLQRAHGMSPEQYRQKWNLPPDYPMIAPAYSAERSALARRLGLGRKPSTTPPRRARKAKT